MLSSTAVDAARICGSVSSQNVKRRDLVAVICDMRAYMRADDVVGQSQHSDQHLVLPRLATGSNAINRVIGYAICGLHHERLEPCRRQGRAGYKRGSVESKSCEAGENHQDWTAVWLERSADEGGRYWTAGGLEEYWT